MEPDIGAVDSRRGWLVVAAAAVSMLTDFGIAYSFGAFFESMAADFGTGAGATALLFSVTLSLSFALAPITGRYTDRLGPRPVLWAGAALLAGGLPLRTVAPSIVVGTRVGAPRRRPDPSVRRLVRRIPAGPVRLVRAFVFIVSYAGGGIGKVAAATLVGLIGGASIIGRLGPGDAGRPVSAPPACTAARLGLSRTRPGTRSGRLRLCP